MRAVIIADRLGHELWPLTDRRPVSLLPIANKPLVQIALEELYDLGIKSGTIISCSQAGKVSNELGNGSRFGMKVHHVEVDRPVNVKAALDIAHIHHNEDWLAVRGDMLRPLGFIGEALARVGHAVGSEIFTAMGIATGSSQHGTCQDLSWENVREACRLHPVTIDTLRCYLDANIMALKGLVPGIRLPGRTTPDQIVVGPDSRVACRQAPHRAVTIGARCLIHRTTVLDKGTVIGSDTIVDRGARLEQTIVLPGSHVGRNQHLIGVIVDGTRVICPQTGAIVGDTLRPSKRHARLPNNDDRNTVTHVCF